MASNIDLFFNTSRNKRTFPEVLAEIQEYLASKYSTLITDNPEEQHQQITAYIAKYGKKPLTRKERANNVKKKDFFSKYSADAQAVLDILLDKYMNQGITEVEDIKVLSLADFANYGKPAKIVKLFGGKAQYETAVRELEASIYEEVEVG